MIKLIYFLKISSRAFQDMSSNSSCCGNKQISPVVWAVSWAESCFVAPDNGRIGEDYEKKQVDF